MARLVFLAGFLLAATGGSAAELVAELRDGRPAVIELAGAVDDRHLTNPGGYFPVEPPLGRVVRRIVIENVGREPLANPDIRLNGAPLLPVADPVAALGLPPTADPLTVFNAWRERTCHGTTDLDANREPLEVLRTFGAAFCGDDSRALGAITLARGGEVRFARMQGHSAAEHRLGGEWIFLDADQHAFALRWDNQTLASVADLQTDPLLTLRTKIYGRHATWQANAAWQNSARFDLRPSDRPPKILRVKRPPLRRDWELRRGEKLVVDLGRTPEFALAAREDLRRDPALRRAICVVEFHPVGRVGPVALPFAAVSRAPGEPIYEADAATAPIACQAARTQFPVLRTGTNTLTGPAGGAVRVMFETSGVARTPVSAPAVRAPRNFPGSPRFELEAAGADRVWWQIGMDREFRLVPPNFDRVGPLAASVSLEGALDETFLSPGRDYFFRAKVRRAGVWSEWSDPAVFSVEKPAAPRVRSVSARPDGATQVRWEPTGGEMLVFGSDRLDFVPEVFGVPEATRLEAGALREHRPAKNQLATISARSGEAIVPARAAYRLIQREGGALSVPSALWRRADVPARALQNRHEKAAGALIGRDVAVEIALP